MADLPSIADRLTDIEIASGAPVTESTMRKIGSDINLLLDALGLADGATGTTGTLSDITSAFDLVAGHTMDLQVAIPANTTGPVLGGAIGTYASIPYIDHVFYARLAAPGVGLSDQIDFFEGAGGGNGRMGFTANIDGAGVFNLKRRDENDSFVNINTPGNDIIGSAITGESLLSNQIGPPVEGFVEAFVLSGRDGNSITAAYLHSLGTSAVNIYRSYRLNLESLFPA